MRKLLMLVAIVAALLVGATVVAASIPDSQGIIHGCYKNSTGDLKVIDDSAVCPTGYTALNWQQQAPVPIFHKQVVTETNEHTVDAGSGIGRSVACPAGSSVTGGGYVIADLVPVRIVQSNPDQTFPPGGPLLDTWSVRVVVDGDPLVDPPLTFNLQLYAVCVALDTNT